MKRPTLTAALALLGTDAALLHRGVFAPDVAQARRAEQRHELLGNRQVRAGEDG